jgi:hypothetical protein
MSDPFTLELEPERDDPLGVLISTALVVRESAQVRIDPGAVRRFARAAAQTPSPSHAEDRLHCTWLPPRRRLNYLLALEALNFSFWDDEPRWRVSALGSRHDGYWALAAALHRALREDALPVWDAAWLAELKAPALAHLLRGEGHPPPLLDARLAHLREAGQVLLERWDGQFANLVADCEGSAPRLAAAVVRDFPSFRDEVRWPGPDGPRVVRFYKRAQICAADLARLLADEPLGRLEGLERLTAFADYKVPQVLRREGILVPAPSLAARIDRREELPAGSEAEVALRAATIWACEWIARAVNALRRPGAPPVSATQVDWLLWSAGQDKAGLPPYHRTRTIYY